MRLPSSFLGVFGPRDVAASEVGRVVLMYADQQSFIPID
jgi:hypothetical protein